MIVTGDRGERPSLRDSLSAARGPFLVAIDVCGKRHVSLISSLDQLSDLDGLDTSGL